MILLDVLSCGMPWPESRKMVYRNAPEGCRAQVNDNGVFLDTEQLTQVESDALKDLPGYDRVLAEPEGYFSGSKSGVRVGDSRLNWYAGLESGAGGADFTWLDLRELKIKMVYQRRFRDAYQRGENMVDQVAEMHRWYNRVFHTFRRIKHIRWIKIAVREGRARIFVYNEQAPYPNMRVQMLLERSFFSSAPAFHALLDEEAWSEAPPHVRRRIEFWRLEESGDLSDEYLENTIRSDDSVLVTWAAGCMRSARDPLVIERIRERVNDSSLDESKAAIRSAGRLWLGELENDVMAQYNKYGNTVGPAVADFIGSIGLTGRTFLPKILRSMARRGDMATLIATVRALRSFPHTAEAKSLPDTLGLILGLTGDSSSVVDRHPGIASDIFNAQEPPARARQLTLEILRVEAVDAIIETTAQSMDEQTFREVTRKLAFDSPFLDKVLSEIETGIRTDASEYLLELMGSASDPAGTWSGDLPVTRRLVIIARTLLRINKPEDRPGLLLKAISLLSGHVGSFRKDSRLQHSFHIDNYPHEPYITFKSILKGLPDEDDIIGFLLNHKGFSDSEKYIVSELAVD